MARQEIQAKALLGPRGVRTSNRFSERVPSLFLIWGEGRGVSRVRPEGCLRDFAHGFRGVVCRAHAQYPALLLLPTLLFLLQVPQK